MQQHQAAVSPQLAWLRVFCYSMKENKTPAKMQREGEEGGEWGEEGWGEVAGVTGLLQSEEIR